MGGSLARTFPSSGSGIGSRSAEILAAALNKVPLSRILNIAAGVCAKGRSPCER
jgi:hypothetical protein